MHGAPFSCDDTQEIAGVRRARRTEQTTGALDCKTLGPSVQMSDDQRTLMTDVFVRASESPSEFGHLHPFSLRTILWTSLMWLNNRHICVAFVHIFSPNLLSRSDAEKVMAERAH